MWHEVVAWEVSAHTPQWGHCGTGGAGVAQVSCQGKNLKRPDWVGMPKAQGQLLDESLFQCCLFGAVFQSSLFPVAMHENWHSHMCSFRAGRAGMLEVLRCQCAQHRPTRPHLTSLGKNRAKKDEARGHESLGPCINHGSACAIGCKLLLWASGEKVPVPEVFEPILVFCLPDAGCNKSVLAFRSLPLAFCGP